MNTVYLEPSQVPAVLRQGYDGKKFKAVIAEKITVPMDAGLWSGGSRDLYSVVTLDDGMRVLPGQHAAPWDNTRREHTIELTPSIVVVEHNMFCGKDMGLTFYVHPQAAKAVTEIVRLQRIEKKLVGEVRRELAELRRVQPELEAQAAVRGYNDGIAEMKRKLAALNIQLSD